VHAYKTFLTGLDEVYDGHDEKDPKAVLNHEALHFWQGFPWFGFDDEHYHESEVKHEGYTSQSMKGILSIKGSP
jgi:hypothetical protein